MWAPYYCKWLLQSLSCNCSQYAISLLYWASRLSSNVMSSIRCDFTTIKTTLSAKHHLDRKQWSIIVLVTLSATQLHVRKKCDKQSTIKIPTIGQMKSILIFRYCCLTATKHRTPRSVLFPNIIWLQIKICAEQKANLCFCVQYVCNIHCRHVIVCWLFCIQKIVILAVSLLTLTTRWHKGQHSCGWAFWSVLRSLRLAMCGQLLHR
jgi:hypothetical protein